MPIDPQPTSTFSRRRYYSQPADFQLSPWPQPSQFPPLTNNCPRDRLTFKDTKSSFLRYNHQKERKNSLSCKPKEMNYSTSQQQTNDEICKEILERLRMMRCVVVRNDKGKKRLYTGKHKQQFSFKFARPIPAKGKQNKQSEYYKLPVHSRTLSTWSIST